MPSFKKEKSRLFSIIIKAKSKAWEKFINLQMIACVFNVIDRVVLSMIFFLQEFSRKIKGLIIHIMKGGSYVKKNGIMGNFSPSGSCSGLESTLFPED
jgi:hypothetical protein